MPGTRTFLPIPVKQAVIMDTGSLYDTFTHPKVVTSMLLLGIGLGILLSVLLQALQGQWYMPLAFVTVCLVTAVVYLAWLDRQDFRQE
jgi:hydrogenase/urease accessory protein HupE